MRATEQPALNRRRRARRALAHATLLATAGSLAVVGLSSTASGAPTVQDGRYLEGGVLDVTYSCTGADAGSNATLDGLAIVGVTNPFPMPVTITSSAVEPSPSPGEEFDVAFTWDYTVDPNIVNAIIQLGVATELNVSGGTMAIAATEGATGTLAQAGGPHTILLGDGTVPVGFSEGPHSGTFMRTAEVDEPIVFTPGAITSSVTAAATVNLACTPGAGTLTVTDQDGVAPSTTTTTRPEVIATTTTVAPATTAQVQGVAQTRQLPRTGVSSLALAGIAIGLIDLGYLALVAARSRRQRPSLAP